MKRITFGSRLALVALVAIVAAVALGSSTGLNQASAAEGISVEFDTAAEEPDGWKGEDGLGIALENDGGFLGLDEFEGSDPEGTLKLKSSASNIASGTWGTCPWEISSNGILSIHPGRGDYAGGNWSPWEQWADDITAIRVVAEGGRKAIAPSECIGLFRYLTGITSATLSGLDTSSVTDMGGMFYGCGSLASLDLSGWDTSSVAGMRGMFSYCGSLASLDLSGWDTSSVTGMGGMFSDCGSLASLDLSGWDTSSVTDMGGMFSGCGSLASLDLSGWDTSSVTGMRGMFYGCGSLASLDLSGWDTSSVADMGGMFSYCGSLASLDLSGWDTSSVTDMGGMFSGCGSLASLDLSGWDTSSVTDMRIMFSYCGSLASLDLSGWDTSSVTGMGGMFYGCGSLASLDLSGWDTSSVTDMGAMFYGCGSLASLDLSGWDTSSVAGMGGMYNLCAMDEFRIGKKYKAISVDGIPPSSASDGRWWSSAANRWFTREEVMGRAGIADTYCSTDNAILPQLALNLSDIYFSFGNHWDYFGYPDPYYIPKDAYYMIWGKTKAEWMYRYHGNKEWGGNCFGMSSMSSLLATRCGNTMPGQFRFGATAPSQLKVGDEHSSTGKTLTRYIEALHVSQFDEQFVEAENATFGKLDALCSEVLESKKSRRPVIVCIYGKEGGHAVLAYDVTTQSSSEKRVQIYDPNFKGASRYIKLSTNGSGGCTGWYYKLNDEYNWGSSYDGCAISYIPYVTLRNVWTKGGDKHVVNMLCSNSSAFKLTDIDGTVVADVRDGQLVSSAEGVWQHQIISIAEDGGTWKDRVMLYVPGDSVYTVSNGDSSVGQFEVGMVDSSQSASVVTEASEVTFALSDGEELNVVDVEAGAGDSYTVTLDSELESASGKESVELSGMGSGETVTVGTVGGECVVGNGRSATLTVNGQVVEMGVRTDISKLSCSLEYDEAPYDGKAKEPKLTVRRGGASLVEGRDFVVKYLNNVSPGTAAATAYGIGGYAGARTLTFKIVDAPFFLDADPADVDNHGAEVDWMGRAGISTGWEVAGGREFRGMRDVTRCDFAAFLYRLADLADNGRRDDSVALSDAQVRATLATVSDCDAGTPHAAEVAWLVDSGISKGWPNGDGTVSFRPMAKVARQDMAAFLYRFADLRDNGRQDRSLRKGGEQVTFSDVRHGDESNHAAEVEWLASVGVTKGWKASGGKYEFRGLRTVARQDMAAFMSRLNNYLNA